MAFKRSSVQFRPAPPEISNNIGQLEENLTGLFLYLFVVQEAVCHILFHGKIVRKEAA